MMRMALTALALVGVAIWLDGIDGAGTLLSTIIMAAVFLAVGAMFFCTLSAFGVFS
jgi:hypothetical protein